MKHDNDNQLSRRDFLRRMGIGMGSAVALTALEPFKALADNGAKTDDDDKTPLMTYRTQNGSGEKISLLGFGMMRLPKEQEEVNRLVDHALAHGVNYFDTSPMYGGGRNEAVTGEALSRHPRESYYVATKMSNYNEAIWPLEESKKMYYNSFKQLRVDYVDYYLLHGIGQGGMKNLHGRFLDNGLLDFLVEERKAGRIRHLGFSYHGDVEAFDWLVDHQEQYHWDFAQIQMNFLDWRHASMGGGRRRDADAEYLYTKLEKAGIQAVIMEPFRGGRLNNMPEEWQKQLSEARPGASVASWAFRWVGSYPNVLTVLSGMNRMEHLEDNLNSYSPLEPCSDAEKVLLAKVADAISGIPTIPCTTCAYCMPCPYGVDIPANFSFYNDCVEKKLLPLPDKSAADYDQRRQQFLDEYMKAVGTEKWARKCVDCEECLKHCPQQIRIPNQMARLVELIRPPRRA
ncbi:MAG: aldo/keto reductase [Prevotella sp.]|nr:aldo/keto reductase [Prevotella sp.]